ncbi:hypothetical protein P9B03_03035 [Metasolibacillus meyeri]|uniref:Flagellar FliJ protein n=1 Tax=Metasolibacillus meyeri TaxID=1071052 RepID=A0AAW9NRR8_9BACL|nr:hypothetical protein [Metasolibacillus meyeri]MEC1177446.1 hypothetical protein [Metasolibacillus meyeri]
MAKLLTAMQGHLEVAEYHLQCMEKEQQKQNKKRFLYELQAFQTSMMATLSTAKEYNKSIYKKHSVHLQHKAFFHSMKKKHIVERAIVEKIEISNHLQAIYAIKRNNKFDARKGFYHKERPNDSIIKLGTYYVQEVQQLAQQLSGE